MSDNMRTLPRINISLSERERSRLERLATRRGTKLSRAISDAVTHMLASLELREPIHVEVPSEQAELEERT